jgi:hypothetical protein
MDDGETHPENRQEGPPQNCGEGQALSVRPVPEAKSEACKDAGPLVLP